MYMHVMCTVLCSYMYCYVHACACTHVYVLVLSLSTLYIYLYHYAHLKVICVGLYVCSKCVHVCEA